AVEPEDARASGQHPGARRRPHAEGQLGATGQAVPELRRPAHDDVAGAADPGGVPPPPAAQPRRNRLRRQEPGPEKAQEMTAGRRSAVSEKKPPVYGPDEVKARIEKLGLTEWYLDDEGWLRRKYNTDGWPTTLMLVNAVGFLCEAAWHHADLSV